MKNNPNATLLFTGNSNIPFATNVANRLKMKLGQLEVGRFSDGEIRVEYDDCVRGSDLYIIQSTCAPVNDNLMELLIMADGAKRSNAGKICAVIPYYGYSRQDRRPGYSRVAITAKLVADMIVAAGIDYVITIDIHSTQTQGFFNIQC